MVEVKFSPRGRRLLTRAENDARIWDVENGQSSSIIILDEPGMRDVAFSPDGRFIATAADKVRVHPVWIGAADNSESSLLWRKRGGRSRRLRTGCR